MPRMKVPTVLLLSLATTLATDSACDCPPASFLSALDGETSQSSCPPRFGLPNDWTIRFRYCQNRSLSRVVNDDTCADNPFCENQKDLSCTRDKKCNAQWFTDQVDCTEYTTDNTKNVMFASLKDALTPDVSCGTVFDGASFEDKPLCVHSSEAALQSIQLYSTTSTNLCFSFDASLDNPCDGSCIDTSASSEPYTLSVAASGRFKAWIEFTLDTTPQIPNDACKCTDTSLEDWIARDVIPDPDCGNVAVSSFLRSADATSSLDIEYRYCETPVQSHFYQDPNCHAHTESCVNANQDTCTVHGLCKREIISETVCTTLETSPLEESSLVVGSFPSASQEPDLSCGTLPLTTTPVCDANAIAPYAVTPTYQGSALCFPFVSSQEGPCQQKCVNVTLGETKTLDVSSHGWLEFTLSEALGEEQPNDDRILGGPKNRIVIAVLAIMTAFVVLTMSVVFYMNWDSRRRARQEEMAEDETVPAKV
mmetsp:Transcript_24477/g.57010  ORF Transcript_24477/g.57010 Transcript_24477/m.57010 type:complete len:480 (+) Transcript_24477:236-1675(+)|eukprot:CAMPEP_0116856214 /NCGR_PEP_ID=MMETSP0418-20121206/19765_1 /TAXON_ID=1158023 /ORGANISM="Astrosyne radiata, Strain 13vi08-1A" /LENGTH=479 /DNA_ID=CAMNT_0004489545 /DNA_START=228 /DNA_END=1667 /DNA_ORIENTATION=-